MVDLVVLVKLELKQVMHQITTDIVQLPSDVEQGETDRDEDKAENRRHLAS